jgi:hypothetical protein
MDRLELDFVSWRRPPSKAQSLGDDAWRNFLVTVSTSWSRSVDKVSAIHRISSTIWVRAIQLRELIGLFPDAKSRVEVVISFVLRLTDPQNMKVMRACIADQSEWYTVVGRVGTLALFPHFQPEDYHFDLDLTTHEDRLATALAVQLAAHESLENLKRPKLVNQDGSEGELEYGISSLWQNYDSVPQVGRIIFQYIGSPEDRKFGLRKDMAIKYGNWCAN